MAQKEEISRKVFGFLLLIIPLLNWYDQGESDCLIKTKHCDIYWVPRGFERNVISAQCSDSYVIGEEIQGKRG